MRFHRTLAVGILALSSLALVSCSSSAVSVVGTWGEPDVQGKPSLIFEEGGQLHGSDGCNNLMGGYDISGAEVQFINIASTMMFCEGVDDWLSQAATAQVTDTSLTVFDESGAQIGTLTRATE